MPQAWQHIYSNVERDRSPSKTSGFQTLFYSKDGLSEEDVAEIEERVFYVFGDSNPIKHVFFRLKSGKMGFGQVAPIDGRDAAGREGLYIAHTLVFDAQVFETDTLIPSQLFGVDIFITSLDAAFQKGDSSSGNINPIDVNLANAAHATSDWDVDNFRKLIQLAVNHKQLSKDRKAAAIVGDPEDIRKTIASVMSVLPAPIASQCTFDTFFERGGNLGFTYCLMTGFSSAPRQPLYVVADTEQLTIRNEAGYTKPVTTFGRWLDETLASKGQRVAIEQKREAFEVAGFLDKAHNNDVSSLDTAVLHSVLDTNPDVVKARIKEQLQKLLPETLADRLLKSVYTELTPAQQILAIRNGFETTELLEKLFTDYQNLGFAAPDKKERSELASVLESSPNDNLDFLLLIWGGGQWQNPVDKWRIRGGLEEMSVEKYRAFWSLAVPAGLVKPMDLLVDGKENVFTELITRSDLLPIDETPDLVKTLVKSDQFAALSHLAPYLQQLDGKQLKKIRKRVHKKEEVPADFLQTLTLID